MKTTLRAQHVPTHKNIDLLPFERNLNHDQRLLILMLGAMRRITNQGRIQSIAYLLKAVARVPFEYEFRLRDHPVSEALAQDLFRLRSQEILGQRLVQTKLFDSDRFTSLPCNFEYSLTPFAETLLHHLFSEDPRWARFRASAETFCSSVSKNGYLDHIERYASWVYILKDLRSGEPREVTRFYEKEHEFERVECDRFLSDVSRA